MVISASRGTKIALLGVTLNALLALPYGEEDEDEGPPPSLEAMHQKAQQMAAQHSQHGGQVVPTRGIEELDELIRKKEDEIKKGSFLHSLNTIISSTGLRTSFAPSGSLRS